MLKPLACLALFLSATALAATAPAHDVIFRGARVLDGTGNPWIRADVAIRGDRISGLGDLAREKAVREVDASALYLAPGFIDVHSHAGPALATEKHSGGPTLLAQGITTVVVNPDGGGPVDLEQQRRALRQHGLGVNVALMIGHGAVRTQAVGLDDRAPSGQELERMRDLVRRAMEAGAFGLSSGLFYAPATFARTEEVVELAKIAGEYGGVYSSHIRDESDYNVGLLAAVDEVIRISREGGLPGIVSHIKALGPRVWGLSTAVSHRIERARAAGLEVWADQYPYNASSTGLSGALLPNWALAGGRAALLQRLKNPETRAQIRAGVADNLDRRGGAARIRISEFAQRPHYAGRFLSELAGMEAKPAVDLAIEMLEIGSPGIVSFNMHDRDVDAFMRQPWTMTCSDGGIPAEQAAPHPRSYGSFPRKIRHYVLEREVVDLPFAIRSMSHLCAAVFRMENRGIMRTGAFADLVVFDLDRVNDPATYDDPHRVAEGMVYVLVNGQFAIDGGKPADVRSGRVLHRQSPDS
jgi:N-acyl-D-amino-acid deacylase